jgi:hypothetical protein
VSVNFLFCSDFGDSGELLGGNQLEIIGKSRTIEQENNGQNSATFRAIFRDTVIFPNLYYFFLHRIGATFAIQFSTCVEIHRSLFH